MTVHVNAAAKPPTGDLVCTCPTETPATDHLPGHPLTSGFTWHGSGCPVYEAAELPAEVQVRLRARFREFDRARQRAAVEAQTAIVG